ncbi:All-trans-phytoene synthase [bacterium HR29]|nr:All-trans-phytoene synthase [bacterium HR29]
MLTAARLGTITAAPSASSEFAHVLATHGRTFAFATRFLPRRVRGEVTALYAFCRFLDDLVDEGGPAEHAQAAEWREWLAAGGPAPETVFEHAIGDLLQRVPGLREVLVELADALLADARPRSFRTEAELDAFCRGVAGTVGVAMALLLGVREPPALAAADALGRAMQRTNILRDIGEDLRRGRCYIPRETLSSYGLTIADLDPERLRGVRRSSFEAMLAREAATARALYRRGLRGIAYLPTDCRFGITAAAYAYRAILDEVLRLGAGVLVGRAATSALGKLRCAARAWWDLRFGEVR